MCTINHSYDSHQFCLSKDRYLYSSQNGQNGVYYKSRQPSNPSMIQSPKLLNPINSTRPYKDEFNVESVYSSGSDKIIYGELTDEEIDVLINSESDDYSKPDILADLSGDDYADAMMAELGLN